MRLKRGHGRCQRTRRAAKVAHGQRHLGLGDDAAGARQFLMRTKATGGAPQQFPGSEGLHLIRWPWAGDVAARDHQSSQTKVVDLTADLHTIDVVADRDLLRPRCGPFWCWSMRAGRSHLQRIDGTDAVEPQGLGLPPRYADYPALDRFAVSDKAVYDLAADALVTFERPSIWWGDDMSAEPSTIVYWMAEGEYRVLNLAAVPPAQ